MVYIPKVFHAGGALMLISLVADPLYIRLVFRAVGASNEVVRAVDISWAEASDLHDQLGLLLEQDPHRPPEEESGRYLTYRQHDCQ
jgi:hypothetical protein